VLHFGSRLPSPAVVLANATLAEARDCLQKAAGEPEAYRWLGYLEAEEGNWNSALDAFRTARDKGARNKRELERWMRKVEGKIR